MKKQILSEELKRMNKLAGLMNESDSVDEARYGRGSVDPWADIETGGEYSKSKERVSASYKRQKKEDSLGSTSYQSFTNKIKRLGNLMTDDEAVEMMDDMKRMLSQDEIMDVYNFVDRNNISSPIYTYLDQYKGETGSYGLEEGEDVPPYEGPEDPMDHQVAEVMIKEGQLGRAITKMLIESIFGFERGPSGTNRGEIGHKDYEKDMAKWNAELKAAEERREQAKKNYETPSYNTNTGGGWTPETLIDFVKKRYNVEVPEEYKESDSEKPWMAIQKIKDYLANLAKG